MKKQLLYLFLWLAIPLDAQWTQQNSGTSENLNDVYCISADTVVVVGNNGTILRTTNGGTDWLPVSNPTTENLHQVQFADSQTGYAVGDNGTLLKTTDGGASWQMMNINTTENLYAIAIVNVSTLIISATNSHILKTTDIGTTWTTQTINEVFHIQDFQVINDNIIYGTGGGLNSSNVYNSFFIKTLNQGQSWNLINISYNESFALHFFNEQNGYVVGNGVFSETHNASTFTDFPMPVTAGTFDIFAFSEMDFWLVGYDYRTGGTLKSYIAKYNNDPNDNYYDIDFVSASFLNAIHFYDTYSGYIVGNDGIILKNETGLTGLATGIEREIMDKYLKVNPNPAINFIIIENINPPYFFKIFDIQGNIVLEDNLFTTNRVDIANFNPGIYILKIIKDEHAYIQKFIKK